MTVAHAGTSFAASRNGATVFIRQLDEIKELNAALLKIQDKKLDKYLTKPYSKKINIFANSYILISEFCKNGSLETAARNEPLELKQKKSLFYLENLVTKMADFGKVGIYFPDIKPGNFILNENNRLLISDVKSFFISETEKIKRIKGFVPTNLYLPPEACPIPKDGLDMDAYQR